MTHRRIKISKGSDDKGLLTPIAVNPLGSRIVSRYHLAYFYCYFIVSTNGF